MNSFFQRAFAKFIAAVSPFLHTCCVCALPCCVSERYNLNIWNSLLFYLLTFYLLEFRVVFILSEYPSKTSSFSPRHLHSLLSMWDSPLMFLYLCVLYGFSFFLQLTAFVHFPYTACLNFVPYSTFRLRRGRGLIDSPVVSLDYPDFSLHFSLWTNFILNLLYVFNPNFS